MLPVMFNNTVRLQELLGSSLMIPKKDTQANSEANCNRQSAYLISNQICTSLDKSEKNTPEFWTGIKRYRYSTGNDVDKKEVQNSDIINCVYGRCPIDSATVKYTNNCRHKQDGFACIFNDTSDNITTVRPSSESLLTPFFISASLASSFYIEATSSSLQLLSDHASKHIVSSSINTRSTSAITNHNDRSTQAYSTNITTFDKVTEWSENNSIQSTPSRDSNTKSFNHNTVTSNSENRFPQPIITTSETSSKNVPQQSSVETNIHEGIQSSGSTYVQSNKESSILPTSVTSEFVLNNKSKYDVVYMSTNTVLTSSKHDNIVILNLKTTLTPAFIISSKSSSFHFKDIPTKVPPTFPVKTSLWMKNSVVMQTQSNIGISMLQTSALMYSQSKISSSTSVTLDITTALYSLIVKNKSATESNGGKRKNSSTTSYQNDKSRNQQLSTGLIVGISVSILCLFVLIIGIFGICRLRNQRAFKEKSLDFPSPINTMSQYQDIGSNSKKDTQIIEKDLTHPVVSATDDDKPFRLTDKTSNGNTNKPNDPYASVMKKPVTTKADNTSNSKTIKSDIAHDEYSVVMKIPKKDMDKDEHTPLDIPESNYDSMNQPRPISDNESGNIYNTSIGHRDDTDPTYNTTTHIKAKEEKYESDYDHV
ncbi:serine-rich adhesin for platelets-like [Mytilus edulis]|uniref:serine-rich adhesin for platelets-like n=1 Tax=Mytilus edulis TaxID=6550 RepID=UPI0039F0BB79